MNIRNWINIMGPAANSNSLFVKDLIVEIVQELQGCKLTELISHKEIYSLIGELDINVLIGELVEENRLVELEYILPKTGRVKSFLLPSNTRVFEPGVKVYDEKLSDYTKRGLDSFKEQGIFSENYLDSLLPSEAESLWAGICDIFRQKKRVLPCDIDRLIKLKNIRPMTDEEKTTKWLTWEALEDVEIERMHNPKGQEFGDQMKESRARRQQSNFQKTGKRYDEIGD